MAVLRGLLKWRQLRIWTAWCCKQRLREWWNLAAADNMQHSCTIHLASSKIPPFPQVTIHPWMPNYKEESLLSFFLASIILAHALQGTGRGAQIWWDIFRGHKCFHSLSRSMKTEWNRGSSIRGSKVKLTFWGLPVFLKFSWEFRSEEILQKALIWVSNMEGWLSPPGVDRSCPSLAWRTAAASARSRPEVAHSF